MSNLQGLRRLRDQRQKETQQRREQLMFKLNLAKLKDYTTRDIRVNSDRKNKAILPSKIYQQNINFLSYMNGQDRSARDRPPNLPFTYSIRRQSVQGPLQTGSYSTRRRQQSQRESLSRNDTHKQQKEINKQNFVFQFVVGKGGFGKVWKVMQKKTGKTMAMKQMLKLKIISKKSVKSVMNQRSLISKLYHPFLVNMIAAFQDRDNLYLVMDYLNGGDLRYHIGKRRKFTEEQTRFFTSCIVVGLQYLHSNNIIHRDIKPQNLVLDSRGYARITDLGISREYRADNAGDTSGTPGYMSPQVICRQNHCYQSDYFALGVICFQFMLGRRPYIGKSRKQIRDHILSKQVQVRPEELPRGWSSQAVDFVNRLIQRKPSNRLGYNGIQQLKNHPWLRNVNWTKLIKKDLQAPYVPLTIEQNYEDYKDQISEDSFVQQEGQALALRNSQVQGLFDGYYFDRTKRGTKNSLTTHATTAGDNQGELKIFDSMKRN